MFGTLLYFIYLHSLHTAKLSGLLSTLLNNFLLLKLNKQYWVCCKKMYLR